MSEPMNVTVEVWPVAADEAGLWLVSGSDAWRYGPVAADGDVHFEVEMLLREHGITDVAAAHSTSWRADGPSVVLTYMAVVEPGGVVRERWPEARPVTAGFADAVGKPPTHAATEAPVPRYCDVLLHGLRHLDYLLAHDETAAVALGELWRRHLEPLGPALAGLYSERHVA
jgi:hypothetical protein